MSQHDITAGKVIRAEAAPPVAVDANPTIELPTLGIRRPQRPLPRMKFMPFNLAATLYRGNVPACLFTLERIPVGVQDLYRAGEPLTGSGRTHYSLTLAFARQGVGPDPAGVLAGVTACVSVDGLILGTAHGYPYRPFQPWIAEVTDWPSHVVKLPVPLFADPAGPPVGTELWTLAVRRSA